MAIICLSNFVFVSAIICLALVMSQCYDKDFSDAELAKLARMQAFNDVDFHKADAGLVGSLENELQYEGRRLTTSVDVRGNIHKPQFRDFWRDELKAPEFVLRTLEEGYELPFPSIPLESFEVNNASAREDMEFVWTKVKRLEAFGCIQ